MLVPRACMCIYVDTHKMSKAEINAVLRRVYYDPDGGFGSQAETLAEAREINPSITAADVRDFLRAQKITQFRPVRGKNSFVPPEALYQIQFDLAYMSRVSAGTYKFALIAIDAFSKKLAVIPQKERTAEVTAESLQKALDQLGLPSYALTDDGSEFKREFADVLDYYDIPQKITRRHAIFAERVIRTIKEALVKRVEALGGQWPTYIESVVRKYNSKKHSATGMTPNKAMETQSMTPVRKRIQSIAKFSKKHPKLAVGDKVRVTKKPEFGASYRTTEDAWSRVVFTVASINASQMGDIFTLQETGPKEYFRNDLLKLSGEPEVPPIEADPVAARGPLYAPGARRLRRIPPERIIE